MKITLDEIKYLEKLSALKSSDERLLSIAEDFNEVAEFVNQIQKAEVSTDLGYEPALSLGELREDVAKESITQDEVLMNAPEKDNGYFVVPKVVN